MNKRRVKGFSMPPVSAAKTSFESLKQTNANGAEFWSARDLQSLLGYAQWRRFDDAIRRAMVSCEVSGNAVENHFAGAGKMVTLGSDADRSIADYHLSRFACYLIAQNGDPRKPAIAAAQKYFAIQTRRQELSDTAAADFERLEMRHQTAAEFKALSATARDAGVQNAMFGVFHDAGYKGLYGGLGMKEIKRHKDIDDQDNLIDRMGTTELAANQFRMTQTRDKLQRESITGQDNAIRTHEAVGQEVRQAIQKIGGIMPENLKPEEHIKHIEKRIKTTPAKLRLPDTVAKGLKES
jgi:DNA-damage-inducible protein D